MENKRVKKNAKQKKNAKVNKKFNLNKLIKWFVKNKKIILICSLVFVVLIVAVIGIRIFSSNDKVDEEISSYDRGLTLSLDSQEIIDMLKNKDNIESVLIEEYVDNSYVTRPISIDKACEFISGIKIIEETDKRNEDYYIYYIFTMKDGNIYNVYFEGEYLRINDKNYIIEANNSLQEADKSNNDSKEENK